MCTRACGCAIANALVFSTFPLFEINYEPKRMSQSNEWTNSTIQCFVKNNVKLVVFFVFKFLQVVSEQRQRKTLFVPIDSKNEKWWEIWVSEGVTNTCPWYWFLMFFLLYFKIHMFNIFQCVVVVLMVACGGGLAIFVYTRT